MVIRNRTFPGISISYFDLSFYYYRYQFYYSSCYCYDVPAFMFLTGTSIPVYYRY